MATVVQHPSTHNDPNWGLRVDLAAAFRWTVREGWRKGTVEYHPEWHDDGTKVVLGTEIPADGGAGDLERLLDVVAGHPSTAHYVALRLCRWFVSQDPPQELVSDAARRFAESDQR